MGKTEHVKMQAQARIVFKRTPVAQEIIPGKKKRYLLHKVIAFHTAKGN